MPSSVDSIDIKEIYDRELIDDSKQVFYLYSEMMAFQNKPSIHPNLYQFYIFFANDKIVNMIFALEEDLKQAIYTKWLPFFIFWSGVYILFCYLIIRYVSWQILRPINTLTRRIYKIVMSVRGLRKAQERHHYELEKHDTMYRSVQIDLLSYYSKQNLETNSLYFSFQ